MSTNRGICASSRIKFFCTSVAFCYLLATQCLASDDPVAIKPKQPDAARGLWEGDFDQYKSGIEVLVSRDSPLPGEWGVEILKPTKIEYLSHALSQGLRPHSRAHAKWLYLAIEYENPTAIKLLINSGLSYGALRPKLPFVSSPCQRMQPALACALHAKDIRVFEAFFDGGTPADATLWKKPILLEAVELNKLEHVKYLLLRGVTVDQVYEKKSIFEYANTKEMVDLLEEYGGFENLPDAAQLWRSFQYHLQHNPRRARNIAISAAKTAPPFGKYLLGLHYEYEANKQTELEGIGNRGLALIAFRESGELGNADALVKVAEAFENGSVVKANDQIATEFYFLALARNSGIAQTRLIEKGKLSAPRPVQSLVIASLPESAPPTTAALSNRASSAWQTVGNIFGAIAGAYLYSQGAQAQQMQTTAQTRSAVRSELNSWSEEQRRRALLQQSRPITFRCSPNILGTQVNCSNQ